MIVWAWTVTTSLRCTRIWTCLTNNISNKKRTTRQLKTRKIGKQKFKRGWDSVRHNNADERPKEHSMPPKTSNLTRQNTFEWKQRLKAISNQNQGKLSEMKNYDNQGKSGESLIPNFELLTRFCFVILYFQKRIYFDIGQIQFIHNRNMVILFRKFCLNWNGYMESHQYCFRNQGWIQVIIKNVWLNLWRTHMRKIQKNVWNDILLRKLRIKNVI